MAERLLLLALLGLAACSTGGNDDSSGGDTATSPTTNDCKSELPDECDGIDNDCDGVIDEDGAGVFYRDEDGDGYGELSVSVLSCEALLPGYVSDATDCSDVDASIFPDAPELCDGNDHDCDGEVFEDSSIDVDPWYADLDGDGYGGSTEVAVTACVGPEGYSASNADCNDDDPYISPRAVELCDEEDVAIDEDCDGLTDENDEWAAGGDPYFVDRDGDRYGDGNTLPEWLCERPDDYVTNNDDCDDFDDSINPGGDELCNGLDDDCNDAVDDGVCDTGAVAPEPGGGDGEADGSADTGADTASPQGEPGDTWAAFWSRWW